MTEQFVTRKQLDMDELRARLAQGGGRDYWRSLEELAETEEFEEMLHREFPENASEWADGPSRRNFLKLMGASLAFGGLTNCTIQPEEKIVPWVRAPENLIPGRPLFYATAASLGGIGTGILVESHMGRPTKIEGNPGHPASLGGSDARTQASILDLYDPDRATRANHLGPPWEPGLGLMSQHTRPPATTQTRSLHVASHLSEHLPRSLGPSAVDCIRTPQRLPVHEERSLK